MKVISAPQEPWLHRLRHGHHIYLAKSGEYAQVEWAWEPPEPGHVSGRIGVRRQGRLESWSINDRGQGFDGLMLILPIEGNLPESPPEISETVVRQLMRRIARLEGRVDHMEAEQRGQVSGLILGTFWPKDSLDDEDRSC